MPIQPQKSKLKIRPEVIARIRKKIKEQKMNKKVFIAFAVEDESKRNHLVYQAQLDHSPFEFVDMSVHQPWDTKWKTNCRERVKSCHGLVALISKNTAKADGQLWEIECAYDEKVPVMLMWASDERPSLPAQLQGKQINIWSWPNLKAFIEKIS